MIIEFNPVSKLAELTVPPPKPAKEYLPDWYKNIKPFHTNPPEFNDLGRANRTVKMCMPFADSMTSGYIQESWQDINIEVKLSKDGKTEFSENVKSGNYSFGFNCYSSKNVGKNNYYESSCLINAYSAKSDPDNPPFSGKNPSDDIFSSFKSNMF